MRCPRCYEWINAYTVQISLSFDKVAGVTDLYMVNPDMPLKDVVEEVQRVLIRRAMLRANGVMSRAAEIAGMKYTTFWEMARRLDLAPGKQHEATPLREAS